MTSLEPSTLPASPFPLVSAWLAEAEATEPNDPNAMCLATVDAQGRPSARMVLLKGLSDAGFVFFTNANSRKGQDLKATGVAALCLHWKTLRRQIRIEGHIEPASDAESDAYFQSRSRGSQLGAWASAQSQPLESRDILEQRVRDLEVQYAGQPVPRPPHWHGFRLVPTYVEFWADGAYRLHDRFVFTRANTADTTWTITRLNP